MENDKILSIADNEYEYLKKVDEENLIIRRCDFMIKISSSAVLPLNHPNYNNNRIDIKIFNVDNNEININGEKYEIKTQVLFSKLKEYINNKLELLINYSKMENNEFLNSYALDGVNRSIQVKYGQLLISINGAVGGEISDFSKEFISQIVDMIINEASK